MNEKILIRISLVCSVIGIIALYFLSESIEIGEFELDKISLETIGQTVKINGKVTNVVDTEKVMILTVENDIKTDKNNNNNKLNKLTVVAFKSKKTASNETKEWKGKGVIIIGKVDEYNGKPEIIASEIRVEE